MFLLFRYSIFTLCRKNGRKQGKCNRDKKIPPATGSPQALPSPNRTWLKYDLEALGRIREIEPAVRAIVTSGYGENSIIKDFAAYGFAGAISKPYILKQLEQAISRVLGPA